MKAKRCSEPNWEFEVEYSCICPSPESYLCKLHWIDLCELPNRDHTFESVFLKPCERTKEVIFQTLKQALKSS
ncbi:unnamed protein product [Blepharisma stoltei]|uniref:Uncharacterized protein n=1 Tax=Blepharisma stoltei TaxID=1481888 RepID=A0AAU9IWD7_9CILI|nr:unnamed protein product [Blepharisma stoltei]